MLCLDEYGVTSGVGKVKSINRFDNVFFNMHGKLCECSETVIKLNLERSVEAIVDAGKNIITRTKMKKNILVFHACKYTGCSTML